MSAGGGSDVGPEGPAAEEGEGGDEVGVVEASGVDAGGDEVGASAVGAGAGAAVVGAGEGGAFVGAAVGASLGDAAGGVWAKHEVANRPKITNT